MEARAIQRGVRQSARKMRLVIDLIRGQAVPEADAILRFSKKRAARQIHKVLKSAVANAQQAALHPARAVAAGRRSKWKPERFSGRCGSRRARCAS